MTVDYRTQSASALDCLAVTLPHSTRVEDVLSMIGATFASGRGGHGYKVGLRAEGTSITLYTDGQEAMGHYLQVMGDGCRWLEERGVVLWEFLRDLIGMGAKVRRVDVAVDDLSRSVCMEDVMAAQREDRVVYRGSSFKLISERTNRGESHTAYFGSRQSTVMLRVYDKGMRLREESFCRFEWEFSGERAELVAGLLVDERSDWETRWGRVLAHCRALFDFKASGQHDTNRTRQISAGWYVSLMGSAKYILKVGERAKAQVQRMHAWVVRQVAPVLAVLSEVAGGDSSLLTTYVHLGRERLRQHHREAIAGAENLHFSAQGLTFANLAVS